MADEGRRVRKINTKKKFVADGVFQAELNEFLTRCLGMDGYAGIEVRATSMSTEIRVKATKTREILEKSARKVRELKSLIEKRYNFNDVDNKVELAIKPLPYDKNLCASAQAENLKYKLLGGTPVRLAANNILAQVMKRGGAKGCEIIISGKIRGQRAKSQKYKQGYIISTGQPKLEFVDEAVRHVELRQGVLGVKVKILPDSERAVGKYRKIMPDHVKIHEPKEENHDITPSGIAANQ
ncbi:40s ribosomal protein s3 [Stylonychia lemnae]|uniref:Small ribosomal subunit protein uS3 n=1 Tax=Stylonychia lemnae TaxID=5949 RepID=A0A077ZY54_STYLE|nr:40s ribosomal protein s3 [Stylonychia lemnae]|eukprot:CDW74162.1 40s ribosomal protein s3 [Stylonychia lemnae]